MAITEKTVNVVPGWVLGKAVHLCGDLGNSHYKKHRMENRHGPDQGGNEGEIK